MLRQICLNLLLALCCVVGVRAQNLQASYPPRLGAGSNITINNVSSTGTVSLTGRVYIGPNATNSGGSVYLARPGVGAYEIGVGNPTALNFSLNGTTTQFSSTNSGLTISGNGGATYVRLNPATTGAAPFTCSSTINGAMALNSSSVPNFCKGSTSTWQNASGGAAVW